MTAFFVFCFYAAANAQSPGGVGTGNLQLWIKADAGTSTTTNGAALSGWNDQSPSVRNVAQGTAGLQPTFYNTTNLINFNPSVNFDGTEEMSFSTASLPNGNNARTAFAVGTANGTAGSNQWIYSYGTQTANQNFSIGQEGGTNRPFNGMWGVPADVIQSGGADFSATPIIISAGFSGNTLFVNSNQRANTTKTNNSINTVRGTPGYIGRSAGGGVTERWNGQISEVISFNVALTANQIAQVNTYLAIKYGITLDATAAINYRSSAGSTIWSYSTNSGYNNDIAGVGRDDNSGLNQKQSKSVNTDDLLTIGLGSINATNAANANTFAGTDRFFIWGNNDGATNTWSATESPSTCYKRIAREWKIQESGTIGTMLFRVPESGATANLPSGINGAVYMLVDADGDFSAGAVVTTMTKVGNNWEVTRDVGSGTYITFATSTISATMAGTSSICSGNSTNLSIALTGPTPWSLTYTDGSIATSVTGITASPYTPSVKPYAASTTYTITALTSSGCTTPVLPGLYGSTTINLNAFTSQIPLTGIQSRYALDNNANDETSFNPGTLQNAPTATTDRFGIANTAYSFNGTNQYISTTKSFINPNDFTLSLWFKTNTTNGGKLIGFGNNQTGSSGTYDRHIYMSNSGQVYFGVYPGVLKTLNSTKVYNDNTWHMVTASLSSTNGMKLYMDGVLIASDVTTTSGQNFTGWWKIGYDNTAAWTNSPNTFFWSGSLDDIFIYDNELSAAQILTIYNGPDGASSNSPVCDNGTLSLSAPTLAAATYGWTGPNAFASGIQNPSVSSMSTLKEGTYALTVTQSGCSSTSYTIGKINPALGPLGLQVSSGIQSYYKMNNNAIDEQNNNSGQLQNAPTAVASRFGISNSAYSFNGSTQSFSTSVAYTNPTDFTLSIWFNTSTTNGGKLIGFGSNQTGASGNYDRHIYMDNNGQIYFGVYPGAVKTINSTTAYNDNAWHMATASLSSTNGMKLYVDGVLVASDATTLSGQNYTGYWRIGYDNTGGWTSSPASNFFAGSLDDVIIYTSELTAAQVMTLYQSPDGLTSNTPCIGTILNLTAPSIAGVTYAWTGPNSFASSAQNPNVNPYLPASTGTYTLVTTVTATGCKSTSYVIAKYNTTTAGQWTGYTNNSWQTVTNWCGGALPISTTDVTIPAVTTLPVNSGTANAKNLTIDASASLTNANTGILNIYGNFTNSGTFTDNSIYTSAGVVNFTGSTAQSITGATTFSNLTLNNTAGLTLNNATTVNSILTLTAGTLTTGGNLNQNLYTGAIAGTGAGSTSGNIRFFKTIWGDKYHYLSVPIAGLTAADWNDNVTVKFGANSNLYSYNEALPDTNRKVGWTAIASTATALQTLKGYAFYFPRFTYNTLLDVTGTYTHSAVFNSGTLTNTASTTPVFKAASDGWHLVGNPYPSEIDWDAASGWTKTGLDNAIYMWDTRQNKYVYYVAGVGVNGGSRYIGSMQGFFVKVSTSGGTGSLAMNKNVRVTSILHDVYRNSNSDQIFRLQVAMGADTDETLIRFSADASEQFDHALDAYKLLNESNVPSLFSISSEADYSINSLPNNLLTQTIPLQLNVMTAGVHVWTADLSHFTNGERFVLEDRLLQTFHSLNDNPTYTTTLAAGEQKNRFFIHYSKRESLIKENENAAANGGIQISTAQHTVFILFKEINPGKATISIVDALGKLVYTAEDVNISSGRVDIPLTEVNAGIYIVKVLSSSGVKNQQVVIQK